MSTNPKPWERRPECFDQKFLPWEDGFDIDQYCQRFASVRTGGVIPDMVDVLHGAMKERIRELEAMLYECGDCGNIYPIREVGAVIYDPHGSGRVVDQYCAPCAVKRMIITEA